MVRAVFTKDGMEALPRRMRERMMELYDQGVPTKQIAERLGSCRSGTRRIRQHLRERGTLEPLPPTGGYASQLTDDTATRLRALVAADPGSTRQTLKDRLGVTVDVRTVGRWLAKLGIVLKKSRSSPPSRSGRTSRSVARTGTRR
jgi:transposase